MENIGLFTFIATLPKGIETNIGERGVLLSGDQIQRLGVARALYRNPKLLIMDESTSALDSETEKELIKDIHKIKNNRTLIIVSHKLSTLSFCDKLYQMKQGNMIKAWLKYI